MGLAPSHFPHSMVLCYNARGMVFLCAQAPLIRREGSGASARWWLWACAFLLLAGSAGARQAGAAEVVLLVADRLERADLWEHPGPNLARLRRESAVGLMSSRFLMSSLPESATVALGAGSYVQYEGSLRWRGGGDREDSAAFHLATGGSLPAGALYCRERERLSLYSNPGAPIGALGTALHAAKKRTACLGNADLPNRPGRAILSVLMDERGVVDTGDVGPATQVADPLAPGGMRVNVTAMASAFERVAPIADVVAIAFGDTARLAAVREDLSPMAYRLAHDAALNRLDALVGALRARLDPQRTAFFLVVPAPPVAPSPTEQTLTPLFVVGRGFGPGLLISATTRQPGCVANADVPATIAALVGAGPLPQGAGWPLSVMPHPDVAGRLRDLDEASRRVARWRFRIFWAWGALLIPAVFGWPILVGWGCRLGLGGQPANKWETWVAVLCATQLAALALPAADWLATFVPTASFGLYLLGLAGCVAVVAIGSWLLERTVKKIPAPTWIAVLTITSVLGDASFGSRRLWRMMVSCALTEGVRFYGVGNEVMGPMVALALVALAGAMPSRARASALVAGVVCAILSLGIGYPTVGANLGGGLSAAVALGTLATLLGEKRGWRFVAVPLAAAFGVGLVLTVADLWRPPEAMSHIGRAVRSLQTGGWEWFGAVVERKAKLNEILMRRTRLASLYFGALPVLLAVALRPPEGVHFTHAQMRPLLVAGVVGSVAALLLNDSGVIAGGLMLAFLLAGAGYLELGERQRCVCWP